MKFEDYFSIRPVNGTQNCCWTQVKNTIHLSDSMCSNTRIEFVIVIPSITTFWRIRDDIHVITETYWIGFSDI